MKKTIIGLLFLTFIVSACGSKEKCPAFMQNDVQQVETNV